MAENAVKPPDEARYDYDDPVEIAPGIHWVGFYDPEASFHCNPYLLLDGEEAVLFDPGSVLHFPIVARKVMTLVDPSRISHIILQHQDPDLCGAVPVFEEVIARDDLRIACHRRAGTFIRYYGVQSELYHVDAHNYRLPLASGRVLEFAYTPYLHSPGAIVTFDTITRTLFTSDIFGSFSDVGRGATGAWELVATEAYLDRMAGFHCSYMPRGAFLQTALDRIERFGAATIAPQHGSVVQGELVARAIGRLRELEVGQALDEPGMPT